MRPQVAPNRGIVPALFPPFRKFWARSGCRRDQLAGGASIDLKTPEALARTGSIPDLGSGRQLEAAFSMPVGQVSTPLSWEVHGSSTK